MFWCGIRWPVSPATSSPASAARACARGAGRSPLVKVQALPRPGVLGPAGARASAIRRRGCWWSASPPPRTAATARAASSPATAPATSSSRPSTARASRTSQTSVARGDGLRLTRLLRRAAGHDARRPPTSRSPDEIASCREYLAREWALLRHVRAVLALGRMAMDGFVAMLREERRVPPRQALRLRPRRFARPRRRPAPVRLVPPVAAEHVHRQAHRGGLDAVLRDVKRHLAAVARGAPHERARIEDALAAASLALAPPVAARSATASFASPSPRQRRRIRRGPAAVLCDGRPALSGGLRAARPVREPRLLGAARTGRASWQSCGRSARCPELLVVAVDGDNSFFVNGPLGAYEDLVTTRPDRARRVHLPRRARPREPRAASGVSMGGYAALRIALDAARAVPARWPRTARCCSEIPGRSRRARPLAHGGLQARVRRSRSTRRSGRSNDPLAWARRPTRRRRPRSTSTAARRTASGSSPGNQDAAPAPDGARRRPRVRAPPGDHGYDYVRTVIDPSLRFLGDQLRGTPGAADQTREKP